MMLDITKLATYKIVKNLNGFWGKTATKVAKESRITYSHTNHLIDELKARGFVRNAKPEECRTKPEKRSIPLVLTEQGVHLKQLFNQLSEILGGNGNGTS